MPKLQKILLADNRDTYRETCVEFLRLRGYQVADVASPESCLRAVETDPPHLVILDQRLLNDEDEQDVSGLALARRLPPGLPKIMLTAFPTWERTRDALTVTEQGAPPVAFYISKLEGLEALQRYVERAFAEHVRLNWELQVDWKAQDRVPLVRSIEPGLEEAQSRQRAEELEDLLCRLFLNAAQVEFDRALWQEAGLAALQVFVSASGKKPEPLLVVCGRRDLARQEAERYRQYALRASQVSRRALQTEMAETIHYAANCYTLGGLRRGGAHSLQELYQIVLGRAPAGLQIDVENQHAWVDGRLLKLTAQEFKLLCFLYERADELCTRRELIEDFFCHNQYDEFDESQKALVNTNISRLRTELEADPQNPRYLQTVRGRGYRLTLAKKE
jgi:DNA-binding response OmpR family regulator